MANRFGDQEVNRFGDAAAPPPPKPPEASPVAKAGKAFAEGLGLPALLDIMAGANRYGTPQEIAARQDRQKAALQGIVQGIAGEPGRVWDELARTGDAMLKGDLTGTAYHLAGAVPFMGAPAQQVAQDVQRGDPAAAVGHTAAMVLPFLAGPAARAGRRGIAAGGAAMETAAPAARAAVKAGGRDVAAGAGKTAVGAVLAKSGPLGEVADVLAGAPFVKSGIKQMGRGVRAGYAAGKQAAEAARAAAPVAEAAAQYPEGSMGVLSPEYFQGPTPRSPLFPVPDIPPPTPPRSPLFPIPDVPPEPGPPAAAAPEPAPVVPAAAEIAAQLEASMRAETLTDYLVRNNVPAAMLEEFGEKEWQMVADQAGVKPPSPENIQAIRGNLAQYDAASQITAKTPAEAAAEFAEKKATRNKRKPKVAAPPADVEAQLADSLAAVEKGERPVAQVADEGAAKPTASETRVNSFAERLAAEKDISLEDLGTIAQNPEALRYMDNLGRSLGISGSLAPGEVAQIVDRVKQLRGGEGPAAPVAAGTPTPQGPQTLRDLIDGPAAPRARRSKPVR